MRFDTHRLRDVVRVGSRFDRSMIRGGPTVLEQSLRRRRFLGFAGVQLAGAAGLGAGGRSRLAAAPPAASERITVGVIGLGERGTRVLEEFLAEPDVEVLAVCDVHRRHHRERPWGTGRVLGSEPAAELVAARGAQRGPGRGTSACRIHDDARDVLARDDLDAIVVATPDHWHAPLTLAALAAGKDVYCEKPVTHRFAEGQAVCRAVAARQAILQVGSQQRSEAVFARAVELVRNGHLGAIERVEVGLPPGYATPMGDATVREIPAGLDYDAWCGPAEVLPYMVARHHRWWRGHSAYGGGVLMDWIGHHNDIAHWGIAQEAGGPTRVEAVGWRPADTDIYDTPQAYRIECTYPGGVTSVIASDLPVGTRFIGTDGWLFVTRGKLTCSDPRWTAADFAVGDWRAPRSPGHVRNFVDGVKTRTECIAPAEHAHRSITPGHLAYVSHALGRPLAWDAAAEQVRDDPEAQTRLEAVRVRPGWEMAAR
jgi:predicted dehydrogenase